MDFFGLTDPWIWGAYVGCILCTVLCCAYGWIKRNESDGDSEDE